MRVQAGALLHAQWRWPGAHREVPLSLTKFIAGQHWMRSVRQIAWRGRAAHGSEPLVRGAMVLGKGCAAQTGHRQRKDSLVRVGGGSPITRPAHHMPSNRIARRLICVCCYHVALRPCSAWHIEQNGERGRGGEHPDFGPPAPPSHARFGACRRRVHGGERGGRPGWLGNASIQRIYRFTRVLPTTV
jgi:hypothetical protein